MPKSSVFTVTRFTMQEVDAYRLSDNRYRIQVSSLAPTIRRTFTHIEMGFGLFYSILYRYAFTSILRCVAASQQLSTMASANDLGLGTAGNFCVCQGT